MCCVLTNGKRVLEKMAVRRDPGTGFSRIRHQSTGLVTFTGVLSARSIRLLYSIAPLLILLRLHHFALVIGISSLVVRTVVDDGDASDRLDEDAPDHPVPEQVEQLDEEDWDELRQATET
jgi:hypothetical protein